ncbi:MAG: 4Fe-4S binding protein [Parabacteroides sp.]|nr:4Fe-4S binding protein [Parabacteroides sp.]
MLRKIRLIFALLFFTLVTLLFLDFTGTVHAWFGWMAKIQFFPALLALNVGVVLGLIILTLAFGRLYCSVICPLGVFQDGVAWLGKKRKKNRYRYSKALNWLRYGMLGLFIVAFVAKMGSLVALLAPYSAYGRMVNNLLQPVWQWGNNGLAYLAERADSYSFYSVDIWMKSLSTFLIAVLPFIVIAVLAWRNGRTYCNTICPVGTVLGFFANYSWLKPVIDTSKCVNCGLCACNCKSACIHVKEHTIDYSRCVACMDCIGNCHKGAISYVHPSGKKNAVIGDTVVSTQRRATDEQIDNARRSFLTATAVLTTASVLKAQEKNVDGGLAKIEDKQIPDRATPLTPPGSLSARNMAQHCTACQLCVSVCPNQVLRPSKDLMKLMQPEMSYERGYCRPECTKCSDVCPAGAIRPVTVADKSAIQIGHAVWVKKNCIPLTDGVDCGNCARHCPVGAIQMVPSNPDISDSPEIPVVNVERCIGCGACEHLCPARPFSAIYVEGHEMHRTV